MKSPLEYDAKVVKEFGISQDVELPEEVKIGFVRTQFEEIQKFLLRERVELILAEAQSKSDIEAIAAEARTKVASHRNTIKGIVVSLDTLKQLLNELQPSAK